MIVFPIRRDACFLRANEWKPSFCLIAVLMFTCCVCFFCLMMLRVMRYDRLICGVDLPFLAFDESAPGPRLRGFIPGFPTEGSGPA